MVVIFKEVFHMGMVYGITPYVYEELVYFYAAEYKIYVKKKLANRILENGRTISFPIRDCYLTKLDYNVLLLEPGYHTLFYYEDREKQIHTVKASRVYRDDTEILALDINLVLLYGTNENGENYELILLPEGQVRKEIRRASGRV